VQQHPGSFGKISRMYRPSPPHNICSEHSDFHRRLPKLIAGKSKLRYSMLTQSIAYNRGNFHSFPEELAGQTTWEAFS